MDQHKTATAEVVESLNGVLREIGRLLGSDTLTVEDRETLTDMGERITDIVNGADRTPTAQACNTDCPAYAHGTCRYTDKTECARYRDIYEK